MTSLLLAALLSAPAAATKIQPTPLARLVRDADYVLVGTVDEVTMVDVNGGRVVDPEARTGPGSGNTIRLHVVFGADAALKAAGPVPKELLVPEWRMWHRTLDLRKADMEGKRFIFLLDKSLSPVSEPESVRSYGERAKIEKLLLKKRP